jgi:hypothetical protein
MMVSFQGAVRLAGKQGGAPPAAGRVTDCGEQSAPAQQ